RLGLRFGLRNRFVGLGLEFRLRLGSGFPSVVRHLSFVGHLSLVGQLNFVGHLGCRLVGFGLRFGFGRWCFGFGLGRRFVARFPGLGGRLGYRLRFRFRISGGA